MKAEDFIASLSEISNRNIYRFEQLRNCIPLGKDGTDNFVVAHREENVERYHHTCITGANRTDCICRLVLNLACLYEKTEAMFLVLSPRKEYGELLRLHSADITIPFVNGLSDCFAALETLKGLIHLRSLGAGYPRLFLILDGLEELPDAPQNGGLEIYKTCLDVVGNSGVEVVTGVNLLNSIFSGHPGSFAGIGNCIVTTKGDGKADVTYVNPDSSLTLPKEIVYPDFPSLPRAIEFFNALP